jgi:hypothetical protein
VGRIDVERAGELFTALPQLDALDAVHAATCLNRGIPVIVSADTAFDAVDGFAADGACGCGERAGRWLIRRLAYQRRGAPPDEAGTARVRALARS